MKPEPQSRRLLKAREAISYLGVSRFSFQKLVHDGLLPVVQMFGNGSKWMIDRNDLDAFIERQKTTRPE
jgi:excisionase family DNA binding protein